MKRQKIQLLILCALLLVVIVALFAVRSYNSRQAEEEATKEAAYTVLTLAEEDVKEFSFSGGSEAISLVKTEEDWKVAEDATVALDKEAVSSLLGNVLVIQADMQIEGVTDFAQYGFDDPLATVTLKLQDDSSYEIVFGHYNEMTAQYYLRIEGNDTVYVLSDNIGYRFHISLENLKKVETEATE